jgi:hypothetical protein
MRWTKHSLTDLLLCAIIAPHSHPAPTFPVSVELRGFGVYLSNSEVRVPFNATNELGPMPHCLCSHVQCITLPRRTCGGAPARPRVASLHLDSAESQGVSPYLARNAGGTCRGLILPEHFSLKLKPHQTQVKMRSKGAYAIDPLRMKWRNCYSYLGGCRSVVPL